MHTKPKNYREYTFQSNNQEVKIVAMAHPIRYNKTLKLEQVLDYLEYNSCDVIVSFSDTNESVDHANHEKTISEHWKKRNKEYHEILLRDFTAPNIYQFNQLYKIVSEHRNKKIVFYCGAGLGRSGTMVASLILRSLFERKYNQLKINGDEYKIKNTKSISGVDTRNIPVKCSDIIYEAVRKTREIEGAQNSVETCDQIRALIKLEYHAMQELCLGKGLQPQSNKDYNQFWKQTAIKNYDQAILGNLLRLLNCYTNGGALFRLFNGSWNRNHISRVNECMEKLKSTSNVSQAKKLLKNLYDEMNKTSSFNPKGALMDILYYLDWKIQYNTIPLDLEIEKPACCMLL